MLLEFPKKKGTVKGLRHTRTAGRQQNSDIEDEKGKKAQGFAKWATIGNDSYLNPKGLDPDDSFQMPLASHHSLISLAGAMMSMIEVLRANWDRNTWRGSIGSDILAKRTNDFT